MNSHERQSIAATLRASTARLPESGIVKVFNYGRTRGGLIPLWAGEGDLPTPRFITEAMANSAAAGETFYTYQRGLPQLRESLARYHQRLYGRAFSPDDFIVTGGGMQAIQLAMQMVGGDGAEVIVPTPAWPNFRGAIETTGARAVAVPMTFSTRGWTLDLERLFAAVTEKTRAIVINSPSNPTGWMATRDEVKAILDFTRRRGLWIIADEIYNRYCYADPVSPSFQEFNDGKDRILFAQTFSKNWAMTGWRIGWLQAPVELGQTLENLVQYNSSGVAAFMQRGAIAAIEEGETFVAEQIARARAGRDIVGAALRPFNSVHYAPPDGAFYAFFRIDGMQDSLAAALRLVDEANIGLAPGTAFGDAGAAYFRVCFLRSAPQLSEAMQRLSRWLATHGGKA
jgi:aspartate/methionine/tyrosine aminotransferase